MLRKKVLLKKTCIALTTVQHKDDFTNIQQNFGPFRRDKISKEFI